MLTDKGVFFPKNEEEFENALLVLYALFPKGSYQSNLKYTNNINLFWKKRENILYVNTVVGVPLSSFTDLDFTLVTYELLLSL